MAHAMKNQKRVCSSTEYIACTFFENDRLAPNTSASSTAGHAFAVHIYRSTKEKEIIIMIIATLLLFNDREREKIRESDFLMLSLRWYRAMPEDNY